MRKATSALVGLLLAGVAATPAHAATIRSQQWHLDAMKADEIWKISTGKGVTVAVIDDGVRRSPNCKASSFPASASPRTAPTAPPTRAVMAQLWLP